MSRSAISADVPVSSSDAPMNDATRSHHLTFVLGDETFATSLRAIRAVIDYRSPTQVPTTSESVRGVIEFRGAAVPIVDLRCLLGRPAALVGDRTCFILVEVVGSQATAPQTVGVMVDAVVAVIELDPTSARPASMPEASGPTTAAGLVNAEGHVDVLLDVAGLVRAFIDGRAP